jgi:hypothetical protein
MFIPDMGHICLDPKILINSIYQGCRLYKKNDIKKLLIYDGTGLGLYDGKILDESLFVALWNFGFIEQDSGNFETGETYWLFNRDYKNTNEHNKALLDTLKLYIDRENLKDEYKNLIRKHKLNRIIGGKTK